VKVFAVIIAGGSGERLWPLSTPECPKQFVTLFGGKSLIRHAMDRLIGLIPPSDTLVITVKSLVSLTKKALPALPPKNILAEPCRRNTAPAVALATREVKRRGGSDAVCCILTADQLMEPASEFRAVLRRAIRLAVRERKIVTLGIRPTYPATGFGYIDTAAKPPRFVEKPDEKTAERFLRKGTYLWNSGMFIFRVDVMEPALRRFAPDAARLLDVRDWKRLYPSLECDSVDYAVMEKTKDIAVVPAAFRWDDVGSWNSVPNRFRHDEDDNTRLGKTAVYGTSGSVVISTDDHLTAVVGLKEVVVVHTDKVTLVCAKSKAQDIKRLLAKSALCVVLALGFSVTVTAERYPVERYQSVIDRQMFGPVPDGFDPTKPPSEAVKAGSKAEKELTREQEQIKSAIRFSAINVTPTGETAVGFSDSSNPKEVRHYYLKVGESRDGWEVKAADPLKATMTIAKGDITLDLELGGNSAQGAGNATSNQSQTPQGGGPRLFGLRGRMGGDAAGGTNAGLGTGRFAGAAGSLRERRLQRMQQREADEKAAAEDKAKQEAAAAAEKAKAEEEKAQNEAEREQQRQQLMQIQEELKKAREARQAAEAAEKDNANSSATSDE